MLSHKPAGFNATFVQRPVDICQRIILPAGLGMAYQVYFFHKISSAPQVPNQYNPPPVLNMVRLPAFIPHNPIIVSVNPTQYPTVRLPFPKKQFEQTETLLIQKYIKTAKAVLPQKSKLGKKVLPPSTTNALLSKKTLFCIPRCRLFPRNLLLQKKKNRYQLFLLGVSFFLFLCYHSVALLPKRKQRV
jgi:hypothetical protein